MTTCVGKLKGTNVRNKGQKKKSKDLSQKDSKEKAKKIHSGI